MNKTSSASCNNNVLQLVKATGKIFYPQLLSPTALSLAATKAGETEPDAPPLLTLEDFPLLCTMRNSLNFLWGRLILRDKEVRKHIAFYGCTRQVGTTFLSFHLAVYAALAQGIKTLYIDTDCDKRPDENHPMGNTERPGLLSAFFAGTPVEECIHRTRVPNLFVLPTGHPVPGRQPNQFPPTDTIKSLAERIHDQFDVVIYDCQSVLLKPIEITYAKQVDTTILVCRYAVSRREVCTQVIETFKNNGLSIGGVVLNQREYPIPASIYDMLK